MNHSSIKTTKGYLNTDDTNVKANYDKLCPLDNIYKSGIKIN